MNWKQLSSAIIAAGWLSSMPVAAVTIGALVDGQVISLSVKEGDSVRKGQHLLTIDARSLQANLAQLKAKIRLAELALKDANVDFEAEKALFDQTATAKRRYEAAILLKDSAIAKVEVLRAQLNEVQARLSYHEIHAPVDGVIRKVWVQQGDTVFHENMKMIEIEAKSP